ncbi:MAG: hypothetical protein EOO07_02480 [Chitinophagaceae bacterium]|nr:MAG: hypothetical protein EOO07_02480 [Chitinophagaceae bacterium]
MNTRLLMASSAILMGISGLACSFLPQEIVKLLGLGNENVFAIVFQILGALYLGFAMLNWMAKANVIGGIYSKPIAMGNFMHFVVGSLTLVKFFLKEGDIKMLILPFAVYVLYALWFGMAAFTDPDLKKRS